MSISLPKMPGILTLQSHKGKILKRCNLFTHRLKTWKLLRERNINRSKVIRNTVHVNAHTGKRERYEKLRNNKIRKLLAFMVALALMVSCMPSAYTISASEAFGDGTEDIFTDGEITSEPAAEESTPDVSSADQEETEQAQQSTLTYENDSVKVTAEALEDGALPQNTALKADSVNENSSVSYDTVSPEASSSYRQGQQPERFLRMMCILLGWRWKQESSRTAESE